MPRIASPILFRLLPSEIGEGGLRRCLIG